MNMNSLLSVALQMTEGEVIMPMWRFRVISLLREAYS
ncbi:hypothetical protein A0O36_02925 [Piscirickettsiaceae bacterium NZ-RLO1]|nr:hypothetical protein A0O36_02925 [Piscirickettsiaceae bacterium NZ-RLO1]